ncbi:adenylate cyclase [Homalodisca vitripennis]|nr:adenylate cyclase [Homalodisca vitripennis]
MRPHYTTILQVRSDQANVKSPQGVKEKWSHAPFSADTDSKGNIYARGSQDMKCVGIQYLEAVGRLMKANQKMKRSVHVSFVPDEEIGGQTGMKIFVESEDFRKLNVGCALDEGIASPDESFHFFYGERSLWHVFIHCMGTPGHGSLLHDDTAGEKIAIVIEKFMARRAEEKKKLKDNPNLTVGDVTTINLTTLEGTIINSLIDGGVQVQDELSDDFLQNLSDSDAENESDISVRAIDDNQSDVDDTDDDPDFILPSDNEELLDSEGDVAQISLPSTSTGRPRGSLPVLGKSS